MSEGNDDRRRRGDDPLHTELLMVFDHLVSEGLALPVAVRIHDRETDIDSCAARMTGPSAAAGDESRIVDTEVG